MVNVRIESIGKKFGGVTALEDLNFEIRDNEFFILLGASGSGKSTTLNIIAGLEKQTSGHIYFDDEEVTGKGPSQRGVAMVFQDYALYPHMTVFKNMAFPLKMRGRTREFIDKKVKETASVLDIGDLLQRKPRELSGGQAQRVALGRCLVRDPSIFLLDEPLSNLDTNIRSQIRTELKLIHRELGKTFIYVTHDQQEALSLGDRIAILHDGNIEQIGPPSKVYNDPNTQYIAQFLGEPKINSFALKKDNGNYHCDGIGKIPLDFGGDNVVMSVRPERIVLGNDYPENSVEFNVNVNSVEDFGSYLVLTGGTEGGDMVSIRTSNLDYRTAEGKIKAAIPISDGLFFDPSTGKRLGQQE